jgi:hypothetical protein
MMCICRSSMLPDKNLASQPSGLQHNNPTGAGANASLELTPIDNVTLSDVHSPGARAQSRRSVPPAAVSDGPRSAFITG